MYISIALFYYSIFGWFFVNYSLIRAEVSRPIAHMEWSNQSVAAASHKEDLYILQRIKSYFGLVFGIYICGFYRMTVDSTGRIRALSIQSVNESFIMIFHKCRMNTRRNNKGTENANFSSEKQLKTNQKQSKSHRNHWLATYIVFFSVFLRSTIIIRQ